MTNNQSAQPEPQQEEWKEQLKLIMDHTSNKCDWRKCICERKEVIVFIKNLLARQKAELESKNRLENELLLGARLATSEEKEEFLNISRENGITGVEVGFKHVGLRETYDPLKNTYYCKYCHEQRDANDMSGICYAHPDNKSHAQQIADAEVRGAEEIIKKIKRVYSFVFREKLEEDDINGKGIILEIERVIAEFKKRKEK